MERIYNNEEIIETVGVLKWLSEFAYKNGCHELGFNPITRLMTMLLCSSCTKFVSYGEKEAHHPTNCVTWLCNDKGCPVDRW
jgi:hypothetical protein